MCSLQIIEVTLQIQDDFKQKISHHHKSACQKQFFLQFGVLKCPLALKSILYILHKIEKLVPSSQLFSFPYLEKLLQENQVLLVHPREPDYV